MKILFQAAAVAGALWSCAAAGQDFRTYEQHKQDLAESYGETLRCRALSQSGAMIELFGGWRPSGPSWTLLKVLPNGVAWRLDAGKYWMIHPDPPEKGQAR